MGCKYDHMGQQVQLPWQFVQEEYFNDNKLVVVWLAYGFRLDIV